MRSGCALDGGRSTWHGARSEPSRDLEAGTAGPTGFTGSDAASDLRAPLDVDLQVYGRWRGGELDRLLDAGHAALQDAFKRRLEAGGWIVRVEVTFSRYGERGSIDLIAFDPRTRVVLIVEIKTVIADVQGLLRPIDAKVRLGRGIARELGWDPLSVVPGLVVAEDSTPRRRIAAHAALFIRFALRGWAARRWLASPDGTTAGLHVFVRSSYGTRGAGNRPGRQRVRRSRQGLSSRETIEHFDEPANGTGGAE